MELTRQDWAPYLEGIANAPGRRLVAIESLGQHSLVDERIDAMCDGVCTRHPLRAIGYEERADVFEVAVGLIAERGPLLRFFVAAPRRIVVREAEVARAIVVTDAGGSRTVVVVFTVDPRGTRSATRARPAEFVHVRRRAAPEAVVVSAGTEAPIQRFAPEPRASVLRAGPARRRGHHPSAR